MTTYKCNKCGQWWNSGPTRDMKYDKPCADCLTEVLNTLRNDRSLWKSGGIGGQDAYVGMPAGFRNIDEILSPYIKYKTEE